MGATSWLEGEELSQKFPSQTWRRKGKRNHFGKERANHPRCLRSGFLSLWCWAPPGLEESIPRASDWTASPCAASLAAADPPPGKSAASVAAERKSLLIKLMSKLTTNSDPQSLLGAKASGEPTCQLPLPLLPKGVKQKQSRFTSAALSDNYSASELKSGLCTDNLMYSTSHRPAAVREAANK